MRINDDFFYLPAVATFSFNCQAVIPKKIHFFFKIYPYATENDKEKMFKNLSFLLDEGYMKAFFNNFFFFF